MSGKTFIVALLVIAFSVLVYFGWKFTSRSAYESAEYTVERSDGRFEIRSYPELVLASTEMSSSQSGGDGSFMRLFRYISGKNADQQKIAMTTPVFVDKDSDQTSVRMGFVVPAELASAGAPEPSVSDVSLVNRPPGRYAVARFSGVTSDQQFSESENQLRKWMKTELLQRDGDGVESASYDPPWTPGFLRRNEVMIRLVDEGHAEVTTD